MWLDVPMTDAQGMDVGQATKQLIHVQFDERNGYRLLLLVVVTSDSVYGFGNEFQYQVQVHFVLLFCLSKKKDRNMVSRTSYTNSND